MRAEAGAARLRAWLLLLALVTSLLVAAGPGAGDARACSCASGYTSEERLQKSDAVFSGEAVDVEENFVPGPPGQHLGPSGAEADLQALGSAEATLPEVLTSETAAQASSSGAWRRMAPAAVVASLTLLLLATVGTLAARRRRG